METWLECSYKVRTEHTGVALVESRTMIEIRIYQKRIIISLGAAALPITSIICGCFDPIWSGLFRLKPNIWLHFSNIFQYLITPNLMN